MKQLQQLYIYTRLNKSDIHKCLIGIKTDKISKSIQRYSYSPNLID